MNQTQICFCDICYKTIYFTIKSQNINSKTHKRKQKNGSFVNEYEFNKPDFDEVN